MKGVTITQYGGPDVLTYSTDLPVPVPDPDPAPPNSQDKVLIKVLLSGINYIDTYFRTGLYPVPGFPFVPGREAYGVVEQVFPGTSSEAKSHELQEGDRVLALTTGTYAEYSLADAKYVYKLPANTNTGGSAADNETRTAAVLLQGLTALTLIREAATVRKGDWVLVPAAAGGTGGLLVQLLHAIGARVIGVVSSEEKADLIRGSCEVVIVASREREEEKKDLVLERVMQVTNSQGVDVVFDGVGKATFETSLACLARKGQFVSFGNASGAVPPFPIARLAPKCIRLSRPQLNGYIATREEFQKYTTELFGFIERGELTIRVHGVYDLKDVRRAHEDLESRRTTGKLLLRI